MVKKKLKVIWEDDAKSSLRRIYKYIKKRESIEVAKKVRDKIVASAKTLNNLPEKFAAEPYLKEEPGNNRYKVIWSYKIIYEVTEEAVIVLDIFHTSRDPSNLRSIKGE